MGKLVELVLEYVLRLHNTVLYLQMPGASTSPRGWISGRSQNWAFKSNNRAMAYFSSSLFFSFSFKPHFFDGNHWLKDSTRSLKSEGIEHLLAWKYRTSHIILARGSVLCRIKTITNFLSSYLRFMPLWNCDHEKRNINGPFLLHQRYQPLQKLAIYQVLLYIWPSMTLDTQFLPPALKRKESCSWPVPTPDK